MEGANMLERRKLYWTDPLKNLGSKTLQWKSLGLSLDRVLGLFTMLYLVYSMYIHVCGD